MTSEIPGMMVAIYAIRTAERVYYVGRSANPRQRNRSHNAARKGTRFDSLSYREIPEDARMEIICYAHPEHASDTERALQIHFGV